jgi:large subunit ribosomal protein L23
MAALWTKKTTTTTDHVVASPRPATKTVDDRPRTVPATAARVLVRPHLTEKSSILAERGQYTFIVLPSAEKVAIARAVATRYGVHPVRVAIVHLPGKSVRYGKTVGRRSGVKKAIVTLKNGEKIPFGVKT